jgi:hypothetical protein
MNTIKKSVSFKNTRKVKLPFTKAKHHNIIKFKNTHENVEARKGFSPKHSVNHNSNNNNNSNKRGFFHRTPRHIRKEKVKNTIIKTLRLGKHYINNSSNKTRKA